MTAMRFLAAYAMSGLILMVIMVITARHRKLYFDHELVFAIVVAGVVWPIFLAWMVLDGGRSE